MSPGARYVWPTLLRPCCATVACRSRWRPTPRPGRSTRGHRRPSESLAWPCLAGATGVHPAAGVDHDGMVVADVTTKQLTPAATGLRGAPGRVVICGQRPVPT